MTWTRRARERGGRRNAGHCWYRSNRRVTLFTRVIVPRLLVARLIRSGRARAAVGEMLRDRYVSGRSSKRGSAALRAASDSDDSDNSATRPDVVELEERGGDDDISENHADDPAGDEDGRGDVPSVPGGRRRKLALAAQPRRHASAQIAQPAVEPELEARRPGAHAEPSFRVIPPRRRGQRALGRSRDRLRRGRGRHAPHRFGTRRG